MESIQRVDLCIILINTESLRREKFNESSQKIIDSLLRRAEKINSSDTVKNDYLESISSLINILSTHKNLKLMGFKPHEVVLNKPAKVARFGARQSKNVKKKVKCHQPLHVIKID